MAFPAGARVFELVVVEREEEDRGKSGGRGVFRGQRVTKVARVSGHALLSKGPGDRAVVSPLSLSSFFVFSLP
jgi:hypothetical protein